VANETQVPAPGGRDRGNGFRGAPARGSRGLTAILPNGRTVWLDVSPALQSAAGVRRVAWVTRQRAAQRRALASLNNAALERLSQTVAEDAARLTSDKLARTRRLRRRLVARYNRLDRRVTKAAAAYRRDLARQMTIERQTVRRLGRRDLWDKILVLSSLPLFAAYGERGRPHGVHNLTLTLSLLIWLVGDEIAQALFGSSNKSPYPLHDTDAWSYIAPLGNLLTGWWLLGDRQHERYVTGITGDLVEEGGGGGEILLTGAVDLAAVLAVEHREDFEAFSTPAPAGKGRDVPAIATIASIEWTAAAKGQNARVSGVRAHVDGRFLLLQIGIATDAPLGGAAAVAAVKVGWLVDTAEPAAPIAPA